MAEKIYKCNACGVDQLRKKKWYNDKFGVTCKACFSKAASERFKKYQASISIEQKRANNLLGLQAKKDSGFDFSASVKKQWVTIKSDPERYKKLQEKRSKDSLEMWKNRSDEERQYILDALTSANNCGRSKVSDNLKSLMIEEKIEGFESEGYFHGFYPDEINHELKIIVELYGDIYHCNPKQFKDSSQYLSYIDRTVGEQWQRDRVRLATFYKHGYTVVIVWETDFYNDPKGQIQRIKDEISRKKNSEK